MTCIQLRPPERDVRPCVSVVWCDARPGLEFGEDGGPSSFHVLHEYDTLRAAMADKAHCLEEARDLYGPGWLAWQDERGQVLARAELVARPPPVPRLRKG